MGEGCKAERSGRRDEKCALEEPKHEVAAIFFSE